MHREILSSDFSKKFIGKNASTHGYYSIKEGFSSLSNKIKKTNSQMLSYMYIDGLDEVSHIYGTKSAEVNYIIKVIHGFPCAHYNHIGNLFSSISLRLSD